MSNYTRFMVKLKSQAFVLFQRLAKKQSMQLAHAEPTLLQTKQIDML